MSTDSQDAIKTIFHPTWTLDSLIHRGEAKAMAGYIKLPGQQEWATEAEIITHATLLKARGYRMLPVCRGHNPDGSCAGHLAGEE